MGDSAGEAGAAGRVSGQAWNDPASYGDGGWADRTVRSIRSATFAPNVRRPPRFLFHLLLVVPTVALLHAASSPGFHLISFMAGVMGLGFGGLVWVLRAAACAFTPQRPRVQGSPGWFLVAPVCGAVVLMALITGAPLQARWSMAQDDFTRALELAPSAAPDAPGPGAGAVVEPVPFDVPDRIGTYSVEGASRVPVGVLFHVGGGNSIGFGDGGFAHIPGGPPGGLGPHGPSPAFGNAWFETITFHPLGDDWYVWDAVQ